MHGKHKSNLSMDEHISYSYSRYRFLGLSHELISGLVPFSDELIPGLVPFFKCVLDEVIPGLVPFTISRSFLYDLIPGLVPFLIPLCMCV